MRVSLTIALLLLLTACGGGGGGPSEGGSEDVDSSPILPVQNFERTLSGTASLGSVVGGQVEVKSADGAFTQILTSDTRGRFGPVTIPAGSASMILVTVTANSDDSSTFVCDFPEGCRHPEIANRIVAFGDQLPYTMILTAVAQGGSQELSVNVNPFTTAVVVRAAGNGDLTEQNIAAANAEMRSSLESILGIELTGEISAISNADLTKLSGDEGQTGVRLAMLNAGLIHLVNSDNGLDDVNEVIAVLVDSFTENGAFVVSASFNSGNVGIGELLVGNEKFIDSIRARESRVSVLLEQILAQNLLVEADKLAEYRQRLAPSPPIIFGEPSVEAFEGLEYRFMPAVMDRDGDALSFTVIGGPVWLEFDRETGALTGTPRQADVGVYPDITLSVSDGLSSTSLPPFDIEVLNRDDPPSGEVLISGEPRATLQLSASHNIVDADGEKLVLYQWFRGDDPVQGAVDLVYTLTEEDVGRGISVQVTFVDNFDAQVQVFSNILGPVRNLNEPPVIFGEPATGGLEDQRYEFLPAAGDIDGDVLTFSVQNLPVWMSFDPARGLLSGTPQQADVGIHDGIQLSVTDGVSFASMAPFSVEVFNVDDLPSGSVSVLGEPLEDAGLSIANSLVDEDGISVFSYQWLRDGVLIEGAINSTYTLGDADVAARLSVIVSYIDEFGGGFSQTSDLTGPVSNVNDPPVIFGQPTTGVLEDSTYQFQPAVADVDDEAFTFTIENQPSWTEFDTATGMLTGVPLQGDLGFYSDIQIAVSDGDELVTLAPFAIEVFNVNDAPTGSLKIIGEVIEDNRLSVLNTLEDEDGIPGFSYQWLRGGVNVIGATSVDYLLGDADVGELISARASYTDDQGSFVSRVSESTAAVQNVNDAPVILGEPEVEIFEEDEYVFEPAAIDVDEDTLLYEVQNLPSWASFDEFTGRLTGTPAQRDTGNYTSIVISVSDGQSSASLLPFSIFVLNRDSLPDGSVTVEGFHRVGYELIASNTVSDIDGINNSEYQWFSGAGEIVGATGATYLVADDDVGSFIYVRLSYQDDYGVISKVFSDPGPIVRPDSPPFIAGAPSTGMLEDTDYVFIPVAQDVDDDPLTFSVENLPGWAVFDTATGQVSGRALQADVGIQANVIVSVTDGFSVSSLEAFDIEVFNVNDPAEGTIGVDGEFKEDATLNAVNSISDEDGISAFVYQWLRGGEAIAGANDSIYVPGDADVGHEVALSVRYVDNFGGTFESITPSGTILNLNDTPTGVVILGGEAREGERLSVTHTLADADGLGDVNYQWYRTGVAVDGANSASYVLGADDLGFEISVVANYRDGQGTDEIVASAATAVVIGKDAAALGEVIIVGVAQEDAVLTIKHNLVGTDGPVSAIDISWLRDSAGIVDAKFEALVLGQVDVGARISARIIYSDTSGDHEVVTAQTKPVENVNDEPIGAITVGGLVQEDEVLSVVSEFFDEDGIAPVSYHWLRDGLPIDDAVFNAYQLLDADVGRTISVRASFVDGQGTVETIESDSTAPVINVNDAPVIKGQPQIFVKPGQNWVFQPIASDVDSESSALVFALLQAPVWVTMFDPVSGGLHGTPTGEDIGSDAVVISVSDGALVSTLAFLLTVSTSSPEPEDWQQLGPANASVFSLVQSPHDEDVLLAGTFFGGVYQSTDRGSRWRHITSPFSSATVFSVAFDPLNADVIFVGTFGEGLYRSTDAGLSWSNLSAGLPERSIDAVLVTSDVAGLVLVAGESGVYLSADGGNTFTRSTDVSARTLLQDPVDPNVVYLGTRGSGVYRSVDGGQSFSLFTDGLGAVDINNLFAGAGQILAATNKGVFRLPDGSSTWEDISSATLQDIPVNQVVQHFGDDRLFVATNDAIYTLGIETGDWFEWADIPARIILIHSSGDQIFVAATANQLLLTTDDGLTFSGVEKGIQNQFVGALASVEVDGEKLLIAGSAGGIQFSAAPDIRGGERDWQAATGFTEAVFGLVAHPELKGVLFAGTEKAGVWKSEDNGLNWQPARKGILPPGIQRISQSADSSGSVYAATSAGLFVSRDNGDSWAAASNFQFSIGISDVLADDALPGVIYVATDNGEMFKSVNDGNSYQSISIGLPGTPITQIAAAPFGNLYAVTDGELYVSFDEGESWFPTAGSVEWPVIGVAVDPENPFIAYLSTSGGGVYKTTSDSLSWDPVNIGIGNPFIFTIVVSQLNANVLYAGSVGEIYKSTDGGGLWSVLTNGVPGGFVEQIVTGVESEDTIIASVKDLGVIRSDDGGLNFDQLEAGYPFIKTVAIEVSHHRPGRLLLGSVQQGIYVSDDGSTPTESSDGMSLFVRGLAISPSDPLVLYAASLRSGMFKTVDGGVTWYPAGLDDRTLFDVKVHPDDPNILYVATDSGISSSVDGGASWQELLQRSFIDFALAVDPMDRRILYVGGASGLLLRSVDGGMTWNPANLGLPATNILAVAIDPVSGDLFASAENAGVYRSVDAGSSWQDITTDLLAESSVTALVVLPENGSLLAGTSSGGVFRTINQGLSWENQGLGENGEIGNLVLDPQDNLTVYASTLNGIARSLDGGGSWRNVGQKTEIVLDVVRHPVTPNTLFVGSTAGQLYRSIDNGQTWEAVNENLPTANIFAVAVDGAANYVFAALEGAGVYRSSNDGETWQQLSDPLTDNALIIDLLVVDGTIYAATTDKGVLRSTDGGISWRESGLGSHGIVNRLKYQNDIYAATSIGVFRYDSNAGEWRAIGQKLLTLFDTVNDTGDEIFVSGSSGFVYHSDDGGRSWLSVSDGLPAVNVLALAREEASGRLFAAAEREGIFYSDNGGKSWAISGTTTPVDAQVISLQTGQSDAMFAATNGSGLLRSSDHGVSWQVLDIGIADAIVSSIVIDPFDASRILVGVQNAPSAATSLLVSNDNGNSWGTLPASVPGGGVKHLAASPNTAGRFYAVTASGIFRYSADEAWVAIDNGITDVAVTQIFEHPVLGDLYLGTLGEGVYRSTSSGTDWLQIGVGDESVSRFSFSSATATTHIASLTHGLLNVGAENTLAGGTSAEFLNPYAHDVGIFGAAIVASFDGIGVVISSEDKPGWSVSLSDVDARSVHADEARVIIGTEAEGVRISEDGAATWSQSVHGEAVTSVRRIIAGVIENEYWAGTLDRGLIVSVDSARHWNSGVDTQYLFPIARFVAVDPVDSQKLYASFVNQGLSRSNDGGLTWEAIGTGLPEGLIRTLHIDHGDSGRIYAGVSDTGFFLSEDDGANWNEAPSIRNTLTPTAILPGELPSELYATTLEAGLLVSRDQGRTWEGGVDENFAAAVITKLALSQSNPDVIYAAASGAGVLRTSNGGATWDAVGQDSVSEFVLAIEVDPYDSDRVYLGTSGDGVLVSEDGGDSWLASGAGLFNPNITSLVLDDESPQIIYAGSEGGGVFSIDLRKDSDGDLVFDDEDCAPLDSRLATLHTYYHDYDVDSSGINRVVEEIPDDFGFETAVDECVFIPVQGTALGQGLVAWTGDPWDFDGLRYPLTLPREARVAAVDFMALPETAEFDQKHLVDLGVDAMTLRLTWGGLESAQEIYDGPEIMTLVAAGKIALDNGLKISLTVSPVSGGELTLPADLELAIANGTARMSDPDVIQRFEDLMRHLQDRLTGIEFTSVQVGWEIDRRLVAAPEDPFWIDYIDFYDQVAIEARHIFGPDVPISAVWTAAGFINPDLAPLREVFDIIDDVVSLTWYPVDNEFKIIEPEQIPDSLRNLIVQAGTKQVFLQAVGFPDAPVTSSSTTKQSQFLMAFFPAWDSLHTAVPFVSFGRLHDLSELSAQQVMDADYRATLSARPALESRVGAYVASHGLRSYSGSGEDKPAYNTLRNLLYIRGWFRDVDSDVRSYLMGFSTAFFDFPTDPVEQVNVSEQMRAYLRDYSDITLVHFDGGVPWVESFEDDFTSEELPYSEAVMGVLSLNRDVIPEGNKVVVAINPLGVPRHLIAPYWGYGEGFNFDLEFNRVPNGNFEDTERRLLPPPFDSYSFDDEELRIAYFNYIRRMVQFFDPDYLLIGIEVSAALIQDPVAYEAYFEFHKAIYQRLKNDERYSHIPLIVSFSSTSYMVDEFGVAYKFDEQGPGVREAQLDAFERFMPYTDVIGFSHYPHFGKYAAYDQSAILYDEFFEILDRIGASNKPIAITESGFTADPWDILDGFVYAGTPEKQRDYFELMIREFRRHQNPIEFIINFKVRDSDLAWQRQVDALGPDAPEGSVNFVEFLKFFRDIGLLDGDGAPRESLDLWVDELDRPYVPRVAEKVILTSPDGKTEAVFFQDASGKLHYTLTVDDQVLHPSSRMGLIVDGEDLGSKVLSVALQTEALEEVILATRGNYSSITKAYRSAIIRVERDAETDTSASFEVRVFDDGFAYRYIVPGVGERTINGEESSWKIPSGSEIWYQADLAQHEGTYKKGTIGEIDSVLAIPVTVTTTNGLYMSLSEANLRQWSGLSMSTQANRSHEIVSNFAFDAAWQVNGGDVSPWRVTQVGRDLDGLLNAGLIAVLSPRPDAGLFPDGVATSWLQPGNALWSGFLNDELAFNLIAQKGYVDEARKLGFEYVYVDKGWQSGFPAFGFNDEFDGLADLVNYAQNGTPRVGIIVWMVATDLTDPVARSETFERLKATGAAGVVLDFLVSDSVANVELMDALRESAAVNQLQVVFVNTFKPTGGSVTWPNELTREAVRGLEWNKLGDDISPEHNATVPFTRMIAGPVMMTPVTLSENELGSTTIVHQLATAGVFTSPLRVWAIDPVDLQANPDLVDLVRDMPSVWDETLVLSPSRIGELVVLVRRSGDDWYVFALNGNSEQAEQIPEIDLSFMAPDALYDAMFFVDELQTSFVRVDYPGIDRSLPLGAILKPGGGFIARFTPHVEIDYGQLDDDSDGIVNHDDCAPGDPLISSLHTYYFDLDGDQFGDTGNTAALCQLTPFPGTVALPGDPDDSDSAVLPVKFGVASRIIGLHGDTTGEDGVSRDDLVNELGATVLTLDVIWSHIETDDGVFNAGALQALYDAHAVSGLGVTLNLSPIYKNTLALPLDLRNAIEAGTLTIDDEFIRERYKTFVDFVKTRFDAAPVSIQIGHEVDLYMRTRADNEFWKGYSIFAAAAADYVREQWPGVPVGVTATVNGLISEPSRSLLLDVNASMDIVSATYLPRDEAFSSPSPDDNTAPLEQLLQYYPVRDIHLMQVSYPSSPAVLSSSTRHAQFFYHFFDVWDKNAERIPFVSFGRLHDLVPFNAFSEAVQQLGSTEDIDLLSKAADYLSTTGLLNTQGEFKTAYQTLRNLIVERGWWSAPSHDSRSFLLGFTTEAYDQEPNQPVDDVVIDNVFTDAFASGDMITYHFDRGVPWTNALTDKLTGEMPYPEDLVDTWTRLRAKQPADAHVAVAINPLGVPRTELATYWGLLFTGTTHLPPPFDKAALDSDVVKAAYLNYAKRAIEFFDPEYLITGLEVNLAIDPDDPSLFAKYVALQRHVYEGLRADPAYDDVKVVVSFTAEDLMVDAFGVPLLVDAVENPDHRNAHLQGLIDLLDYVDVVGLSLYPIKSRFGTNLLQPAMYDNLFSTLRGITDKPLAITETGYPADSFDVSNLHFVSDPARQARFFEILFATVQKYGGVEFVANFSTRDLTLAIDKLRTCSTDVPSCIDPALVDFFQYFEHNGVYDEFGSARLGTSLFNAIGSLTLEVNSPTIEPVELVSPDGTLRAILGVDRNDDLYISLNREGTVILAPSTLGMIVNNEDIGVTATGLSPSAVEAGREVFKTRGAHSRADVAYNSRLITATLTDVGVSTLEIELRVFDDGFAYRFVVPGEGAQVIHGELAKWNFADDTKIYFNQNTENYEGQLLEGRLGFVQDDVGAPLTLSPLIGGHVLLTEANVAGSSGMSFGLTLGSNSVVGRFLDDSQWLMAGGTPTPWRVTIAARNLNELVNSDIVEALNEPPDPLLYPDGLETKWIRPGRATWSFWSGAVSGGDFEVQKDFIDSAHELGFEYVTVDAWWENGFILGDQNAFERLAELVEYAHADGRKVDIWVWKNWYELLTDEDRLQFFSKVKEAGVVGVKVDNIFAARSESVEDILTREIILTLAAQYELMINYHGVSKPTGEARTFPNELTREALAGLELNGLGYDLGFFIEPGHNARLPFTRFVVGPGDYTPVTFDEKKIGSTTFTHQLATLGLFPSPVMHVAEHPAVLMAQETVLDLVKGMPTTWDETIVLPDNVIGERVIMARRSGIDWYVFMINGDPFFADAISISLDFLGDRFYEASYVRDETQVSMRRETGDIVTGSDTLDVSMLSGGGFVAKFNRANPETRSFRLGFTSVPPEVSAEGWVRMFDAIRTHGDLIAHSFQDGIPWDAALTSRDYKDYPLHLQGLWDLLRGGQNTLPGHEVYLMINPIKTSYDGLSPAWGDTGNNQSLDPPWDDYAFDHPDVMTAYVNYLRAVIDVFNPTYLAIGIESNILLAKRPDLWEGYKVLHEHAYDTIKAEYPELVVFASIHYEHMLGLHTESRDFLAGHPNPDVLTEEVKALLTHSDLLALSVYPYMVSENPLLTYDENVVAADYLDVAYDISAATGLPIAIDQTGYISKDLFFETYNIQIDGSDSLQQGYLRFLLDEGAEHNFKFINNFVVIDYGDNHGTGSITGTWSYAGILNENNTSKPIVDDWDAFLALDVFDPAAITLAGSVVSTNVLDNAVEFTLDSGFLARLDILSAEIVRVRINRSGTLTDWLSGAISLNNIAPVTATIDELTDSLEITTSALKVRVDYSPFAVNILRDNLTPISVDLSGEIGWDDTRDAVFNKKHAPDGEAYFGLGLRGGPLNRRGDEFLMRNTDNFGYGEFTSPLYSSTPFYYGLKDGLFHGMFVDSPAQPEFDMDSDTTGELNFFSRQQELDYYVMAGPEVRDVARQYSQLVGLMPLPPKWAIGFHQSRFGYDSHDQIIDLAQMFRELKIPVDAFYFDLDYMDNLGLFTWNPVTFDDPVGDNQILEAMGVNTINIVDPSIVLERIDENGTRPKDPLYDFFDTNDFFLRDRNGDPIVGTLFDPFFETSWFDYTHPQAADWYKNNLKLFMDSGVTGIWNDINEPANNFMPQAIYDFGGQNRKDIDARSLYALHEVALTQEAMLERRPNERPFILSRSGYAGSHRYNVNWSGDSLSTFDSLRVSVQMSVHMSLSGMILFGHDIGGFLGTPDPELFTRWMQFATFNPFMRNHAVNTSEFSEPWVYGAPYTGLVREAISQRYRWLPYLYSLVERSSRTAEPTLAPTFFHFLDDPRTQDQIMEFMLGEQMLIAPVYAQGAITRDLYLPAGSDWYEWKTDILFTGGQDITVDSPLESIPVFMRAGAIIPGGPVMQCVQVRVPCWDTTIAPNPPVYADIYAGPDRDFILYEDDGISYEFRDASAFKRTRISQVSVGNERQLQVAYVDDGGTLEPSARAWQLRVHQAADKPSNVSMNGAVLTEFDTLESLEAAERGWYFDPGTDKVVVQFWQGDLPVVVVVTKP